MTGAGMSLRLMIILPSGTGALPTSKALLKALVWMGMIQECQFRCFSPAFSALVKLAAVVFFASLDLLNGFKFILFTLVEGEIHFE